MSIYHTVLKLIIRVLSFSALLIAFPVLLFAQELKTGLLIIGGGASGTTAAIQASRMGVKTILIEETEWLGGMLTSAGVSAIDGNHNLPSGLWAEFRQKLYDYYGGPKNVETGWVSNTLFEPSVGNTILKSLASNKNLDIWYNTRFISMEKKGTGWLVTVQRKNKKVSIETSLLIDATELGDVLAAAGAEYSVGMDSRYSTGEEFAPEKANDIIQDLTYVAILKDYGKGADKTIKRPKGYDPALFSCCCDVADPSADDNKPKIDCSQMITYGRLPNNKYMINWPKCGNDIYLNIIDQTPEQRQESLKAAKLRTLQFVYHLQTAMGFKNLGIAEGEFPTADKLPMIAYHREARRLKGLVQLTLNDVARPYEQKNALYRTGIAVGDYPIDHHHLKNPDAPAIEFVKIKVPSYSIPLGALIPAHTDGLLVAEKSISVTNIVAGASRLQPVVLTVGQAAGALAAVSIKNNQQPREVNIREVQQALLEGNAYLIPFIDVKPGDAHFKIIQKIGVTGILKGFGLPYKWANQTWFYPDNTVSEYELVSGLKSFYGEFAELHPSGKAVAADFLVQVFNARKINISEEKIKSLMSSRGIANTGVQGAALSRAAIAELLDVVLNPFIESLDFTGKIKTPNN